MKNKKGNIIIVVGGNYGSESKGLVTGHLAVDRKVKYAVRTGSINAGHSVPYKGKMYKNQQIPVAWVNPRTKLVIGAGAYVSPEILSAEIKMIEKATGTSLKNRLFIDHRCGAHLPSHHNAEKGMHERMGSTGEGCSEAIKDKMSRSFDYVMFKDTTYAKRNDGRHFRIVDTVTMLNDAYDRGNTILLEGTQGTMLDLHLSHYPYCTSRQTIASSWLAEAGLSPSLNTEVVMVCRTFPIRVAGNSGPLPEELEWSTLAREINNKLVSAEMEPLVGAGSLDTFDNLQALLQKNWDMPVKPFDKYTSKERVTYSDKLVKIHKAILENIKPSVLADLKNFFETTTVTKKLRRIGRLNLDELRYAVKINRPSYIALNFLNYAFPHLYSVNKDTPYNKIPKVRQINAYLKHIEEYVGCKIKFVNWSPWTITKR